MAVPRSPSCGTAVAFRAAFQVRGVASRRWLRDANAGGEHDSALPGLPEPGPPGPSSVFAAPLVSLVSGLWSVTVSLAGCGAGHALLGIHPAPAPKTAAAPLTVDQTRTIIIPDFTAAYQGMKLTGASAAAAQSTAYAGEALRAVHARVKLVSVQPTVPDSPLLSPEQPQVLAVSRGFGFPRFIVAQSVGLAGALPVLHLLTSPDAATPYRISMSAEMVPPATVKPFDPLNQGSPLSATGPGWRWLPRRC